MMKAVLVAGVALCAVLTAPVLAAPKFSFGDDKGEYSNDGECDDPRFAGPGMTGTPLLSDDVLHDASDCRVAFEAGKVTLRGVADDGTIDFGDDAGAYSADGECDDLRLIGSGMTASSLLEDDIMHDATDCEAAYEAGKLKLHRN
jgi:hypothetical protein